MPSFRLIKEIDSPKSTAEGLSVDDTLPCAVERCGSSPILHLYKFVPSAIVGRYQAMEAALNLQRCKELGIEVNRRSTGGGTVIMGPTVMALGFGVPVDHPGLKAGIEGVFSAMSQALVLGLKTLGVQATFRPKNDLEIGGRKIAGLSASLEGKRGILFHTSLLVDFDMNILSQIINTPLVKLKDKGYSCFSERLTTVRLETGRDVQVEEVIDVTIKGFEKFFDCTFEESSLTDEELKIKEGFKRERYENPSWIFSNKHPRMRMGVGRLKTKGGLLEIYLSLAGAVIENIFITGDFFTTTKDLNLIESSLTFCDTSLYILS
jgi:lipoate-protein ligase A